jgi:transcriptional regulator with XRE-family HTH domain
MTHDRIRALRMEKGLTQKQTADWLGVHVRSYQEVESGRRVPNLRMLVGLADLFETSVDYLVGMTDQRAAHPRRK